MTNHEVWDKTIELNGVAIQSVVCMEECSELIKAISKRLRGELDIEDNLAEEMADVTRSASTSCPACTTSTTSTSTHGSTARPNGSASATRCRAIKARTRNERSIRRMDHRVFRGRHHGHADEDREAIRQTATRNQTRPRSRMKTRIPQEKEGKQ